MDRAYRPNPSNTYAYDPYGKIMAQQETVPQPFKYAGQVGIIDEGINLYYMRARYYDANIGRFISEDPAGFSGGLNLYAYVGGNPMMLVDPSGKCPWCIAAGAVGTGAALYFRQDIGAAILSNAPGVDSAVEKRMATHFFL